MKIVSQTTQPKWSLSHQKKTNKQNTHIKHIFSEKKIKLK